MSLRILLIGGSGFLSGATARLAVNRGHEVWAVTRGRRDLPEGVRPLVADRKDRDAFAAAVAGAGVTWDLAVDCIGFQPEDAEQDLAVLRNRADHLVFVSTDFVYDPARRSVPQRLDGPFLADGYGGNKRRCEVILLDGGEGWPVTVLRPGHIYGPGALLGCLPAHGRDPKLLDRLRRREPLRLVGAGNLLQQPVFVEDLAVMILSCHGVEAAAGGVFHAAGPEPVRSVEYYQILADLLGVPLEVEELPILAYCRDHPEHASFLCHRVVDMAPVREAGLAAPATPLAEGLRRTLEAMGALD